MFQKKFLYLFTHYDFPLFPIQVELGLGFLSCSSNISKNLSPKKYTNLSVNAATTTDWKVKLLV